MYNSDGACEIGVEHLPAEILTYVVSNDFLKLSPCFLAFSNF